MEKITLWIMAVLLVSSCATRQEKSFNYYQKNKGELAQLCDEEFPFKEEYIPGIPIIIRDTIFSESEIEIPCPESTPENPKPTVKCPEIIIKESTKTTDTLKVESQRKIKSLEFEIKNLKAEIRKKDETIEKQLKKIEKYKNFKAIGWILLIIIGAGFLIKIFR